MYGQFFIRVLALLFVGLWYISCHDLDNHANWKNLPTKDCGYGALSDRIVGGTKARLGQFPWMARIGYKLKPTNKRRHIKPLYLCAGSIISKWFIISARHCATGFMGDTIYSVRLGDNFAEEEHDCEDDFCAPPTQDINIKKVFRYSDPVREETVSYEDISLFKLAKAAQFNDFVQPICLPREDIMDNIQKYLIPRNTSLEVAGWGSINSMSNKTPNKLLYVSIPVVELNACKQIFTANIIDESMICAGAGGGKDSCIGDSGGPLMGPVALHSAPRYFLFGIVSYGMKWCGIGAAIYTNVTYYMPWILDHVKK